MDERKSSYPMKNFNWPVAGSPAGMTKQQFEDRYTDYPFNPIGHGAERVSNYADANGFVEVGEASTGFMCIKRDLFRQMREKYPALNYVSDGPPHPEAHLYWLFFDCMVDPDSGHYLSEDFAFCRRWRDIGGKIGSIWNASCCISGSIISAANSQNACVCRDDGEKRGGSHADSAWK